MRGRISQDVVLDHAVDGTATVRVVQLAGEQDVVVVGVVRRAIVVVDAIRIVVVIVVVVMETGDS